MNIDFSLASGQFRDIYGANIGPYCQNSYVDLSTYYKKMRFPTIRLHDCPFYTWGVVDVPEIFPLFHVDADDPRNYRFKKTDAYIQSILDCGSQIVYRLGCSIQNREHFRFNTVPIDYAKWADVCIRIIQHYNEGWGDGHRHDIQYWEIWNEAENGPNMWDAPYDEFITFYIEVAKRIKAACPAVKVGGPAFNGAPIWDEPRPTFLKRVQAAGAPLDFCSWHFYDETPQAFIDRAEKSRDFLDQMGFGETESHMNEWNLGPMNRDWKANLSSVAFATEYMERKHSIQNAAMIASTLVGLQDTRVDMTNFYEASNGHYGIFEFSGLPTKPCYSFVMMREFLDEAPIRCHAECGALNDSLAFLAGRADDESSFQIFASNFNQSSSGFDVALSGLGQGMWEVEHRALDYHVNNASIETLTFDSAAGMPFHIDAPLHSVHRYIFRRA